MSLNNVSVLMIIKY